MRRYLFLLVFTLLTSSAHASVVSRLGAIYFYDPLTFDAGALQRGMSAWSGATTQGGQLDAGVGLPFYHELVLRLGYQQQLYLHQDDLHAVTWRFRAPVLESARFGFLSTTQVIYAGAVGLGGRDPLLARHEIGTGNSHSTLGNKVAHTVHGQVAVVVRPEEGLAGVRAGQVGLVTRGAWLFQLYEPAPGPGGKWTITLSSVEFQVIHYGPAPSNGGEGRLLLSGAAPALHFSHHYATYSFGLAPRLQLGWSPQGTSWDWGGLLSLRIAYRNYLE